MDNQEYGVIYLTVCPKKGTPAEWIKYCHIFSALPKSFQENIKHITDSINSKYTDDIVIPMDISLHPGCTTTPESVDEIATDMYNQFSELIERNSLKPCVRCVYTVGILTDIDTDSTHHLYGKYTAYDEVMIKLGTYLSGSEEPGLFKI
jgi:hypothetical protein